MSVLTFKSPSEKDILALNEIAQLSSSKSNKSKHNFPRWLWILLLIISSILVFAYQNIKQTTKNKSDVDRFSQIEQKILRNNLITEAEKHEFCRLLPVVKGYSVKNCELLNAKQIKQLLYYIKQIDAIDNNKIHHILQKHHKWERLFNNPTWKNVKQIVLLVMLKGKEEQYKTVSRKVLNVEDEIVEVIFRRFPDGTLKIANAWIKE